MPYEYYAEYHNYDMIMRSAQLQLFSGQAVENPELKFSYFSGSMVLSFCAVESFLNSIAFLINKNRNPDFDISAYEKLTRISDRLEMICSCIGIVVDKSQGKYQQFYRMLKWRNSLVHAKPSSMGVMEIKESSGPEGPPKMDRIIGKSPYENFVTVENAKIFYESAYDVIEEIKNKTSYDPRAMCSYKKIG